MEVSSYIQTKGLEMDSLKIIKNAFEASAKNANNLASSILVREQIMEAVELIVSAYMNGGCLFVAGNGGSAADAQHLVAELVSKLYKDRDPIRAFAMTVDTSILTAVGNDYGYEKVFERQVRGLMKPNDVFLGITTSGNSLNIQNAFKACQSIGAKSILLSGPTGGKVLGLADKVILAPGERTDLIQENHLTIYHTLCHLIEINLVNNGLCKYL